MIGLFHVNFIVHDNFLIASCVWKGELKSLASMHHGLVPVSLGIEGYQVRGDMQKTRRKKVHVWY